MAERSTTKEARTAETAILAHLKGKHSPLGRRVPNLAESLDYIYIYYILVKYIIAIVFCFTEAKGLQERRRGKQRGNVM